MRPEEIRKAAKDIVEDAIGPLHRDKPVIRVEAGRLSEMTTEAEAALIASGQPIFQRGRHLVRPATQEVAASKGRTTIAACFAEMTHPAMLDALSRAAHWVRYDGRRKKDVETDPPGQVAALLLARFGEWRFPAVAGIVTTPTLRPDHTILDNPGYDAATRLYLAPDPALKLPAIPAFPTKTQAQDALALINDLLDGFPFVDDTSRSVALSLLLTVVARGAMTVSPLHAVRANTAGTGKSYLNDLAAALATGRPCPVADAKNGSEEADKRLVGLLLAAYSLVALDNVNGELGSDLLCQAVERPLIRLRALGASDIQEIESRGTFTANGNGLRVRGDMTRRSLVCDLDAQMERPELRTFAFDPVERVLSDRGRYVAAALTVVRGYTVSGELPNMPPLASYADYDATVRGALVWLGKPDPAQSMERAREDDPELGEIRDAMQEWQARFGLNVDTTAKAIVAAAEVRKCDDETGRTLIPPEYVNAGLRDALLAVASGRGGIDTVRFGKWLSAKKGRIVSIETAPQTRIRVRLENRGAGHGNGVRWRLAEVKAR